MVKRKAHIGLNGHPGETPHERDVRCGYVKASEPQYRIREARVTIHRRFSCHTERRFLAERRITILDLRLVKLGFWWPVINSDWRVHEIHAQSDIENDIAMRLPLSVRYFEVER